MKLVERDRTIINTINKYRFCLSRQIRLLANFSSQSSCDRRLKKLVNENYIERKHVLYGVPRLYYVTTKAKKVFNLNYLSNSNIRVDKILHDILVIDTVLYFVGKCNVEENTIISERELKNLAGFTSCKHFPDFLFIDNKKKNCVEVELSIKPFNVLAKNVQQNFIEYDKQIWIVDQSKTKLIENFKRLQQKYDLEIVSTEVIKDYVKTL